MKCEKCGGNLTLEDVVCPYCETLNEHAVQHIREMNRYKKDFEGTKKEVYTVTKNYVGITVRVIILAVLVVLTIICGLVREEVYSIRRDFIKADSQGKATEYKEIMEQYLADRDYYAFAVFCEEKCIGSYKDNFEEYRGIIYGANYYSYLYDSIMDYLHPYEGGDTRRPVTQIAEMLNAFYKIFDGKENAYYSISESDRMYEVALEMQEQVHALLITYCGLTTEDIEQLPDMSDAQRALLIEERMTDGE